MTAHQSASAIPATGESGAAAYKTHIIACRCQDEGACIMCTDCGHVFAESIPFSDESVSVLNTDLARQLFYHMCTLPRAQPKPPGR